MKLVRKILIVDDDIMVNIITERLLMRHNKEYEITTFTNPVKALENLQEKYSNNESLPDLVLLDIRMPELSGFEFLDKINQTEFSDSLPVIMYTSSTAAPDLQRSQYYKNVIGYMSKPFAVHTFEEILCRMEPSA